MKVHTVSCLRFSFSFFSVIVFSVHDFLSTKFWLFLAAQVHGNGKLDSDGNYDSEDSNCSSGGSIRVTDSCTTATPSVLSPGDHHGGAQTPSVLHPTATSALPLTTPPASDW